MRRRNLAEMQRVQDERNRSIRPTLTVIPNDADAGQAVAESSPGERLPPSPPAPKRAGWPKGKKRGPRK